MVTGAHDRTSVESKIQEMSGSCWQKVFTTSLNTVSDKVRKAFRAVPGRERYVRNAELSHYEAAQIAKQEWLWAVEYFHEVSEPGLVDYAVYSLQAAERKYMYLLDKAREEYASIT